MLVIDSAHFWAKLHLAAKVPSWWPKLVTWAKSLTWYSKDWLVSEALIDV